MKTIKKLVIKNCLGITELDFEPSKINIISGGKGIGKTSILDSIDILFRNNNKRTTIVKDGATKTELFAEIEEGLEIKRLINAEGKTTTLNVSKDGFKRDKPNTFLKELAGEFSINPVEFMQKKEDEQKEILLGLTPMEVTTNQLYELFNEFPPVSLEQHGLNVFKDIEKYYYDQRTSVNGEVKSLKSEKETYEKQLPRDYDIDKWIKASTKEKYDLISEANKNNQNIVAAETLIQSIDAKLKALETKKETIKVNIKNDCNLKRQNIKSDIEMLKEKIKVLENNLIQLDSTEKKEIDKEILVIDEQINTEKERIPKAKEYIKTHKIIDITPLENDLAEVEEMKGYIPVCENYNRVIKELENKTKRSTNLSKCIDLARTKPLEILKNSDMPVEGLSIDDKGNITINNLPINNLSDGEKWELVVNIARKLASKDENSLKLICIDGFERLGGNSRVEFLDKIKDDEFQYFITQVTDGEMKIDSY